MDAVALSRQLRLGIVGFGRMGVRHWQTWTRLPGVEVVAIGDSDPAVRQWASRQHLQCFAAIEPMFGMIDIAVIASPSSTHGECTRRLLNQGIACLVEKPLAPSSEECRQLMLCAKRNGVLLSVGQCERFNPGVVRVLGRLGDAPAMLEVFRHARGGAPAGSDVIEDLLVHDLDWLLFAGLHPSAVHLLSSTQRDGQLQAIECRLEFTSGLGVYLSAGYDAERRREVILSSPLRVPERISLEWQSEPGQTDPLTLQAQAFLQALQGAPSGIASAEDAVAVTQICEQLRAQILPAPACRISRSA